MHTALSFKTFQKHSVIESDGVLNKGQDLWSFTEVCESWLAYGVQEENKTVPGKGAWHPETEHHLAWLLLLLPIRPSQGSHQRGGDLFQALGMPSEPSSMGGLLFPAQYTEEVAQHTEGQHYGGWNHPIPVCTYTVTQIPNSLSSRNTSITLQWTQEMSECKGTETLPCSWTTINPAAGNGTISSGGLNSIHLKRKQTIHHKITLDISSAQADFVFLIWGEEKSSALPLLQQNPCDLHAILIIH